MYKVPVLFLTYDTGKYPASFTYLEKYLSVPSNSKFKKIIIDNKAEDKLEHFSGKGIINIGGDNSCWEFSGWDKGIKYLDFLGWDYDAVLFINDSFLNPGFGSLMHLINNNVIEKCIKEKALVGAGSGGSELKLQLNGKDVSTWNRSHCFVVEKSVLKGLGKLTSLNRKFIDLCIEKDPTFPYFKDDAPMNGALKRGTINWLQTYWHSAFKIEDNWDLFKMKSLAYFNELMLTQRAREFKVLRIE